LAVRDPERHQRVRESLAARTTRALATATGRARERAFYDALFGLRRDRTMGRFYDWERGGGGMARPLREDELGPLLEAIAQHEGDESAAIARHWWARQPEAFHALLDFSGTYLGTLVYLRVAAFDAEDGRRDPALAHAADIVRDAPLREGEVAKVLRFWIWRDRYQDLGSAAHAPHSMVVGLDWASASLAWCVLVVQRVEAWRPFFAGIRFRERPEAALAIGEHQFFMFARDFRTHPWNGPEGAREGDATKHRPASRIVLSQDDFASAVRDALRLAVRPAELASSPLLSSRLLAEWAEDDAATPEMIRELLEIATSSLDDESTRDDRPRRCVELTYLRPAPTQELAAERLGLSFSTYRRQLARGVERVIAYLWEREVRGPPRG
ncbi:MAG: hypothetical protein M3Y87_36655, partial [Myxococcota bacterium]|nr:hypothetical protein [Myxococcota bacterium]